MNQDLTIGVPATVLKKFCLPLFASVVFQQLYNLADSFVAGRFIGENALAAVGNSYELTLIYIAFAFGCNIGCSVVVSRLFGAKQYGELKTAVMTTAISCAVLCLLLMLSGFLFSDAVLKMIQTPARILYDSKVYLDIYILSLPFVFFYNVATGIFAALGDSKTPFWFLVASSLTNIVMDIIFAACFRWGVQGIAWATFICQGISCFLAVTVVWKRLVKLPDVGKIQFFSVQQFYELSKIAVPSIIQQGLISVGNIVIQGNINSFGTGVIAGYSASVKLNNLVITSFTTLGNGISNFTAQNIGANKQDRVKDGFYSGISLVWHICQVLCVLYFIGAAWLMGLFLNNPTEQALSSGTMFLRILTPFYLIVAIKLVADGVLRGAGRMGLFMAATFTDLILRVVLAYLLSKWFKENGIWMAWPIGWTISMVLSFFFARNTYSRNWRSVRF